MAASLSLAGSEVTDAVRATGSEGDGRTSPDSSVGIYAQRTNLITNGGGESGTTAGWTATNGTLTVTTDDPAFGTYALRFTASAANASITNTTFSATPEQGQPYSALAWVDATADEAGKLAKLRIQAVGGATAQKVVAESSVALSEGRNELYVTGSVVEDDRTRLDVWLIFNDAESGDVFDVDGVSIVAGTVPSPAYDRAATVESGSPLVEYTFESNVDDWVGAGGTPTIAQTTSEAHTGSGSMSVTANHNVGARTNTLPSYTGGTVYIFQLRAKIEDGGAATATVRQEFLNNSNAVVQYQDVTIREDAWTLLELLFAPASDGDYNIGLRNLSGGALTYLVDRVRVDAQATDPRVKAAGRAQLTPDSSDITAAEGYWAVAFTPEWASVAPPSEAVVLGDWRDDTDNRLTLTHADGAFTFARVRAGTSSTATLTAGFAPRQTMVVVASRTASALALHAGGMDAAAELTDTFTRSDSTSLGSAETGQTWTNVGTKPLRIESNRLVHDTGGAGYAYTTLTGTPRRFGGVASFVNPGDSGAVLTLISSPESTLTFTTMVHVVVGHDVWYIQSTATGVVNLANLAQGQCAIPTDGTPHEVWVTINGDTLTLEIADQVVSTVTNSVISARSGSLVAWELLNTAGQADPRWDSVSAIVDVPSGICSANASATTAPTLAATSMDLGSQAGTSNHLGGRIHWAAVGAQAISTAQATALAAQGATEGDAYSFPAGTRVIWPAETTALDAPATITGGTGILPPGRATRFTPSPGSAGKRAIPLPGAAARSIVAPGTSGARR